MPDTTPPTLIGVFPANGSTVPNQQTSFFLMFDETLGAAPIIKLTLPGGVSPLTPWIDWSGNVASYNPSFWMPGVWTFTVQDGSVRDVDGNVDPGHISFSVTLADGLPNTAPYMVAMQFGPGDSQTSVSADTGRLGFIFSESGLTRGVGTMELHTENGALVQSIDMSVGTGGPIVVFAGGTGMTIWGLPLHPGQKYYINVPAGAPSDSSGTPSDAFTYHFTAAGSLDLAHAARAGFQQLNAVELGRHGRNQTTVWDYVGIAQIERNGNPMV